MNIGECKDCAFWVRWKSSERGFCHRFPNAYETVETYWCGEFKEHVKEQTLREARCPACRGLGSIEYFDVASNSKRTKVCHGCGGLGRIPKGDL